MSVSLLLASFPRGKSRQSNSQISDGQNRREMIGTICRRLLETLAGAILDRERLVQVNEDGTFQRIYRQLSSAIGVCVLWHSLDL
ncbi:MULTISPECIES: hypothetical protein [Shinella]|jgi:hypothetical protein|nr:MULTISPECIES: hypothetical protein [Shinella]TAA54329.1 hypothetical protein EXZ48_27070 [Shinella sp. JR1-6]